MEFTKENWENAPEGARLEWRYINSPWTPVHFIGYLLNGSPVVEDKGYIRLVDRAELRIILPKRKVTVQLWQRPDGSLLSAIGSRNSACEYAYTLLGEHTFEIERE